MNLEQRTPSFEWQRNLTVVANLDQVLNKGIPREQLEFFRSLPQSNWIKIFNANLRSRHHNFVCQHIIECFKYLSGETGANPVPMINPMLEFVRKEANYMDFDKQPLPTTRWTIAALAIYSIAEKYQPTDLINIDSDMMNEVKKKASESFTKIADFILDETYPQHQQLALLLEISDYMDDIPQFRTKIGEWDKLLAASKTDFVQYETGISILTQIFSDDAMDIGVWYPFFKDFIINAGNNPTLQEQKLSPPPNIGSQLIEATFSWLSTGNDKQKSAAYNHLKNLLSAINDRLKSDYYPSLDPSWQVPWIGHNIIPTTELYHDLIVSLLKRQDFISDQPHYAAAVALFKVCHEIVGLEIPDNLANMLSLIQKPQPVEIGVEYQRHHPHKGQYVVVNHDTHPETDEPFIWIYPGQYTDTENRTYPAINAEDTTDKLYALRSADYLSWYLFGDEAQTPITVSAIDQFTNTDTNDPDYWIKAANFLCMIEYLLVETGYIAHDHQKLLNDLTDILNNTFQVGENPELALPVTIAILHVSKKTTQSLENLNETILNKLNQQDNFTFELLAQTRRFLSFQLLSPHVFSLLTTLDNYTQQLNTEWREWQQADINSIPLIDQFAYMYTLPDIMNAIKAIDIKLDAEVLELPLVDAFSQLLTTLQTSHDKIAKNLSDLSPLELIKNISNIWAEINLPERATVLDVLLNNNELRQKFTALATAFEGYDEQTHNFVFRQLLPWAVKAEDAGIFIHWLINSLTDNELKKEILSTVYNIRPDLPAGINLVFSSNKLELLSDVKHHICLSNDDLVIAALPAIVPWQFPHLLTDQSQANIITYLTVLTPEADHLQLPENERIIRAASRLVRDTKIPNDEQTKAHLAELRTPKIESLPLPSHPLYVWLISETEEDCTSSSLPRLDLFAGSIDTMRGDLGIAGTVWFSPDLKYPFTVTAYGISLPDRIQEVFIDKDRYDLYESLEGLIIQTIHDELITGKRWAKRLEIVLKANLPPAVPYPGTDVTKKVRYGTPEYMMLIDELEVRHPQILQLISQWWHIKDRHVMVTSSSKPTTWQGVLNLEKNKAEEFIRELMQTLSTEQIYLGKPVNLKRTGDEISTNPGAVKNYTDEQFAKLTDPSFWQRRPHLAILPLGYRPTSANIAFARSLGWEVLTFYVITQTTAGQLHAYQLFTSFKPPVVI